MVFIFLLGVCVNNFVLVLGFYPSFSSFLAVNMWRIEPICLHDAHDLMLIMVTSIYVLVYFSFNIFIFGFITFFYMDFAV